MRTGVRLRAVLILLVLVGGVVTVAAVLPVLQPSETAEPEYQNASGDVNLVSIGATGTRLWPFTSRQRRFDTRTLAINVIVMEDAATVRRVLAADQQSGWRVSDPENESVAHPGDEPVVVNGSGVSWNETRGAKRYTYVETTDGEEWVDETNQLHDGAYLGARYHIRMYEVSAQEDTFTAIQAHHEHWDWFRLRHTVGSVSKGRYHVEQQFYGTELISEISRKRFGNGGVLDADGWVTVVDLIDWKLRTDGPGGLPTATVFLALLAVGARYEDVRESLRGLVERNPARPTHVAMFLGLLLVPVGVRVGAIELERAMAGLSPKVVAAPGYLVLAVGLPATAGLLGRRLPADEAFATAVVGLGFGILLDYAYLGITTLPYWVVVHRAVLLVGVGLVAAGGVRWAGQPLQRHRYRVVGLVVWVLALLWPLAGG